MQHSQTHLRSRPIAAGQLRAFEAVARHLNFRLASEELALTQSAVSRQIQSLEEDVGVSLFHRHTRAVELTASGGLLLRAVSPSLERVDGAVRQIRQSAGRKSVSLSTWASFASMWLIPRMEGFQRANPGIDIRIDASDAVVDLDVSDVDVALRYARPSSVPAHAIRLFGEQLTPVISPWLLKSSPRLKKPDDLSQFALIEAGDAHHTHNEWLSWQRWLTTYASPALEPSRWLYFTYGVTGFAQAEPHPLYLRAAPSAGGLYPGECYIIVRAGAIEQKGTLDEMLVAPATPYVESLLERALAGATRWSHS